MPKPVEEKKDIKRIEPELTSDSYSAKESKKIVEIVLKDYEAGLESMQEWLTQRETDLKHYHAEKPSVLETLTKKEWQSDRNLGLCPAVCDTYQATIFATSWNPDTIHMVATEVNDIDNKENLERFTKWLVTSPEGNVTSEIDDFIHNRITQGFSVFHVYWKVWYEWVDRRIPKKNGGYDIKTEHVRFEKGVLENIATLEDIVITDYYCKDIQELPFLIHVIHKNAEELVDSGKNKSFNNIDEKFVERLKGVVLKDKRTLLSEEKAKSLGLSDISNLDLRVFPVDLYVWYGNYTKGGKTEKFRFIVEPYTETLLSGKPLRKITRTGKIPFVGGAFIRRPGHVRGQSLPHLIAPIVNAFNNVFNQKSDFQYVTNMPFGFHNPDEGYSKQVYELIPGVSFPVAGEPSKSVYFPNLQRSMAWAESDIRILFEMLERLTGAASYFLNTKSQTSGTATRDTIVNEKSETRFGLWVKRIMEDISEALTMYLNMYQDWAPPKLGERVLGKDGKQLIHNLSIESLRGNYDVQMSPDLIAGSKTLEKQVQMWMFENLGQSPWTNPMVNPKGSYNLTADTMKALGRNNPERYLGPEPKMEVGKSQEVEDEWIRFLQGDKFEPPQGENPLEHFIGHMQQKAEKYHDLDPEYRPNFDEHLFKTLINFRNFLSETRKENIATMMASNIISGGANQSNMGIMPQPQAESPTGSPAAPPGGILPASPGNQPPVAPIMEGM